MVVHDLDIMSVATVPSEADAPLPVDADRMLPRTAALERFQPVPGWRAQVAKLLGLIEHPQLSSRRGFKITIFRNTEAPAKNLGIRAFEAQYRDPSLSRET